MSSVKCVLPCLCLAGLNIGGIPKTELDSGKGAMHCVFVRPVRVPTAFQRPPSVHSPAKYNLSLGILSLNFSFAQKWLLS